MSILEYALEVAHVWHPSLPSLGKNWVDGFIMQNKGWLDAKWSSNLESTQGGAVNPALVPALASSVQQIQF